MGIDDGLQNLTLASVCDGVLERQFQERVRQALVALRDYMRLQGGKDGHEVVIPLEVRLRRNPEGTFAIVARANPIKPPKPLATERPVYSRPDGMKVRPEIQPDLLTQGNVSTIGAGEAPEENSD